MRTLIFSHLYLRPGGTGHSLSALRDMLQVWLEHLRGPGRYTGDVLLLSNVPGIGLPGLNVEPLPHVPADSRRAFMHRILAYDRVPIRDYDVAMQTDLDVLAVDDVYPLFPKDEQLWASPSDLRTLEWRQAWTLLPKWRRGLHKLTRWRMNELGASACVVASATSAWERNFGSWARLIREHGERPAPHFADQSFLNLLFLTKTVPIARWPRDVIVHQSWEERLGAARLLHFPGARKAHMPQFRLV